jgi:hypothetical protein
VKGSDGVTIFLISLTGTYFDQYIRNTYQTKEYNGCTNSALRNYQQEKEYTREITSTIRDAHHVGTHQKMTTTSTNALREEASEKR